MTIDSTEVRVMARLSASITLGLNKNMPITKEIVAENLAQMLGADPGCVADFMDGFDIQEVAHEDGTVLVENNSVAGA
ncbi:hypothetical protein [Sulfitobacter sp. R18_1]|uniref:hypothetical protein n=1 Tax=Sulfitobacter sp. R18_1 TaxID=2821104 RepID=UPI001ADBDA60|nr:hypothetical protein [Sulfitobacter sp. R18_1]MBO9428119.1 hypothetical protein [Sulfitobacter sp. R18_1]